MCVSIITVIMFIIIIIIISSSSSSRSSSSSSSAIIILREVDGVVLDGQPRHEADRALLVWLLLSRLLSCID